MGPEIVGVAFLSAGEAAPRLEDMLMIVDRKPLPLDGSPAPEAEAAGGGEEGGEVVESEGILLLENRPECLDEEAAGVVGVSTGLFAETSWVNSTYRA